MTEGFGIRATDQQVMDHFWAIPFEGRLTGNWGTSCTDDGKWDVNDVTYINGIYLMIDLDFETGFVFETVDRGTSSVRVFVCAQFPPKNGGPSNVFISTDNGTFFDRPVYAEQICEEGVNHIFEMFKQARTKA